MKKNTKYNTSFYSGIIYDVPPLSVFDFLYEYNYNNPNSFIKISGSEEKQTITFKERYYAKGVEKKFSFSFTLYFDKKETNFILNTNYKRGQIDVFFRKVLHSNKYSCKRYNDIYIIDLSQFLDMYDIKKAKNLVNKGYKAKVITTRPKIVSVVFETYDFVIYPKGKIITHKNPSEKWDKIYKSLQKIIQEIY